LEDKISPGMEVPGRVQVTAFEGLLRGQTPPKLGLGVEPPKAGEFLLSDKYFYLQFLHASADYICVRGNIDTPFCLFFRPMPVFCQNLASF